jgi:uncharacterized protein YrrD
MFRRVKKLEGFALSATDGEVGKVDQFYFDEQTWTIRYLVVETGHWFSKQKVLISPLAVDPPAWDEGRFPIDLSREQVENSPDIDTERPVSREYEAELHTYYNWPEYWSPTGLLKPGYPPHAAAATPPSAPQATQQQAPEDMVPADRQKAETTLRSTDEVIGYHIQARDGEIGHVADFLIDDESWIIRYLVVDTRTWLPGKKVLVAPQWIEAISWPEAKVHVTLDRETIKTSPEFDPDQPISRAYETELYDHYEQPKYW